MINFFKIVDRLIVHGNLRNLLNIGQLSLNLLISLSIVL